MRTRVSRSLRARKCRASADAEAFRVADRFLRRQGVDRVLHRVGRQHRAVVAVGVRLVVVALEADRDGQVAQVVPIGAAPHLDEADARLAIGRLNEHAGLRAEHQTRHAAKWPPIIAPRISPPWPTSRRRGSAAGRLPPTTTSSRRRPTSSSRSRRCSSPASSRRAASGWTAGNRAGGARQATTGASSGSDCAASCTASTSTPASSPATTRHTARSTRSPPIAPSRRRSRRGKAHPGPCSCPGCR